MYRVTMWSSRLGLGRMTNLRLPALSWGFSSSACSSNSAPGDTPVGLVSHIQRMSLHDGPGIRTTVFLKGCNARCGWCHNPETMSCEPELMEAVNGAKTVMIGEELSVDRVMERVECDVPFYETSGGGVTISGGEPLLQWSFTRALLLRCRQQGIHTVVQTNCSLPVRELGQLADVVMADLKLWDRQKHLQFCGIGNETVKENITALSLLLEDSLIVRTPIVPGVNDTPQDVLPIVRFVADLQGPRYQLIPYHPLGVSKARRLGKEPTFAEDVGFLDASTMRDLQELADAVMNQGAGALYYDQCLAQLLQRKREQTKEKLEREGHLDEDDYGRVVPPGGQSQWQIKANHENGSFYGLKGWCDNFCDLMDQHPTYVDSYDALAGRWMYFMNKMRHAISIWPPEFPFDHLHEEQAQYGIIHGIGQEAHFAPDYGLGLRLGFGGLLRRIDSCRKQHGADKNLFFESHARVVRAIQGWIRRHVQHIREDLLPKEKDAALNANLRAMAATCESIVDKPPHTLREACQWIVFYHLSSRTYNRDGAGGQLDALLRPFYDADVASGRIADDNQAVFYIACLLINDPAYWQLGGPDKDGRDQTSHISYLILRAASKLNISLNLTVRVFDGMDERFFRTAVELLVRHKNGWPRFSGDKSLCAGFVRNGFSMELARQRIAVGCNWMSLPGLEYTMNDLVKVSLPKVLLTAWNEFVHLAPASRSVARLWGLYEHHLARAVHCAAEGVRHHLKHQGDNSPELLLNLLSHGPLERGCDAAAGGAKYYCLALDGAGIGTAADSLAVVEELSELEAKQGGGSPVSFEALHCALVANWEGEEAQALHTRVKSMKQQYGRGDSLGDKWAVKISELFSGLVRDENKHDDAALRRVWLPGLFSWAYTVQFGKELGATPDGRHAGDPISHGANPNPGFADDNAATSLATAVAKVQPGFGNTAPMQLELDPAFGSEENVQAIAALIKAHFLLGGTLINANVLDRDTLLAAHADPSLYPDLVVRVTGFTAYFALLTPEFRQLVIDRLLTC